MGPLYEVCRYVSVWPTVLVFGLRGEGRGNVPERGGCIIAANHQSFLDPFLIGHLVSRPVHYLARETLFRFPGFRELIRALNAHPIRRGASDREALRVSLELLRAGEALVMFPEGTRTRDGRVGEVKRGIGALAARAGVPIVPARISGAFEVWPRSRALPRPGRIRIRFGRPIAADRADSGREAVRALEGWLRAGSV
jgi:1-acyl-sn-glycerol-3-phosphate acyltransferase